MTDEEKRFDRREEARLDDMYDAQFETEEEEEEMRPTQEQVIAWAREANLLIRDEEVCFYAEISDLELAFTLAYETGRKDENEACAKVAEQIERDIFDAVGDPRVSEFKPKITAAIRARGQG